MTVLHYALITGGTSGIGYELARLLAKDGYNIVIVGRHQETLERTATDLRADFGVKVVCIAKDLFNKNSAYELYELVKAKGLYIEILVNNAGQGQYGEFIYTELQRELDIIQLNITSVVVLSKLFLKEMVSRNTGKILNVSSIASKAPGPLQSVYHGTKAFIQSFTEAIREEVKNTDVVITALLPGATATDFFNKADMLNSRIAAESELADPAEVARDGYEALKNNKDMIISGFKNKVKVAMSNIMPDNLVAASVHNEQQPVDGQKRS